VCSFSQKESYFSPFGSSFKVLWAIVRTLSDKKCEKILTEEEEEEEEDKGKNILSPPNAIVVPR
jgi:hypothetical protein